MPKRISHEEVESIDEEIVKDLTELHQLAVDAKTGIAFNIEQLLVKYQKKLK